MHGFRTTDPAYWEELSGSPRSLDEHNAAYEEQSFLETDTAPSAQDDSSAYDCAIPINKVIAHSISAEVPQGYLGSEEGVLVPSAVAETLDDRFEKDVDDAKDDEHMLWHSKQSRVANRHYSGRSFWKHLDDDNWQKDGEDGLS